MKNWHAHGGDVVFVCLQRRDSLEVPSVRMEDSPHLALRPIGDTSWWAGEAGSTLGSFDVFAYRSRILVRFRIGKKHDSITQFIEDEFLGIREVFRTEVLPKLPAISGSSGIVWYPVVDLPEYVSEAVEPVSARWLGDGVASFRYRIFDSDSGRAGYVRISRFSTICLGLSVGVVQDVINIVYERILYPMRSGGELVHGLAERQMAEALSDYTVPTELNVYMQRLSINVAVYAALFAVVVACVQLLVPADQPWQGRVLWLTGTMVLAAAAGTLINRVRSRHWR